MVVTSNFQFVSLADILIAAAACTVTREAYSITASAWPSNGRDEAAGHGRSTSAQSASCA